jgi:hypothetical protein
MKNLTTLTNVKTLSSKSANKIKGGESSPVIIDTLSKEIVIIDTLSIVSKLGNRYQIIIK